MRIIKASILIVTMVLSINCFSQQLEFLGLPIHSAISDFSKELGSHRFKEYMYKGSNNWEGGDFWKQKNCYVRLFAKDDIHVDIIEIRIPYYNFESSDEYINAISELVSDLSHKYGQCTCDTLDTEKETDIFFHPVDHKDDLYYLFTWTKSNGELKVLVNNDYIYTILMQYKSIEYINWRKESARFKGQGNSDL